MRTADMLRRSLGFFPVSRSRDLLRIFWQITSAFPLLIAIWQGAGNK